MVEKGTANPPAIAPIVFEGGEFFWTATGSRSQLLDAGACVPSHFPSGRKRFNQGRDSKDRWWTIGPLAGGRWRFNMDRAPDERDAWREAEAARELRAGAPKSPEEWKANKVAFLKCLCDSAWGSLTDAGPRSGGFTLSSDGLREVEPLLAALERAVERAQVVQQQECSSAQQNAATAVLAAAEVNTQNCPIPKARAPLRLVVSAR